MRRRLWRTLLSAAAPGTSVPLALSNGELPVDVSANGATTRREGPAYFIDVPAGARIGSHVEVVVQTQSAELVIGIAIDPDAPSAAAPTPNYVGSGPSKEGRAGDLGGTGTGSAGAGGTGGNGAGASGGNGAGVNGGDAGAGAGGDAGAGANGGAGAGAGGNGGAGADTGHDSSGGGSVKDGDSDVTSSVSVSATSTGAGNADCPQRGQGCCALVLDFSHGALLGTGDLDEEFIDMGCSTRVFRSAGRMRSKPRTIVYPANRRYMGTDQQTVYTPSKATIEKWKKDMDKQRAKLSQVIAQHRSCVSEGVEASYEVVSAHGGIGNFDFVDNAGWWKTGFGDSRNLLRAPFIQGNYDAANKNVCGWAMHDASCFAGWSTAAFQGANQTGRAKGDPKKPAPHNHDHHAGWEANVVVASSPADDTTHNIGCWWDHAQFEDAIETARDEGTVRAYEHIDLGDFSSSYADGGYARCNVEQ